MTLEEQFAMLVASTMADRVHPVPNILRPSNGQTLTRTRTVYSVGEAISQKGQANDAKLGRGSHRDSGSRR